MNSFLCKFAVIMTVYRYLLRCFLSLFFKLLLLLNMYHKIEKNKCELISGKIPFVEVQLCRKREMSIHSVNVCE